ncbi:MAG: membrane protein insertion efficiency factor YidD [Halobacteriovoraceae bacterium]|nr:membrane protein insertion efficiency factor YidD [Halobacteriovoraceae bacterium]
MKSIILGLIKFYQYFLSPFLGTNCRFSPTCSEYAKQCFIKFHPMKAFALTIWRILRCQPYSKGGYDPVPDTPKRKDYK